MRMRIADVEARLRDRPVGVIGGQRACSVLLLLTEKAGEMHILFEVRARQGIAQPGDVCLPGGRLEAGESPLACALRETREEIGLSAEDIRLLGPFDTMHEIGGITIYTFVGAVEAVRLASLRPSPEEVETVFTVPYAFFARTQPLLYEARIVQDVADFPYEGTGIRRDYPWRTGRNQIPVYLYGEGAERRIIWGLTGRIIRWFVRETGDCPGDGS